MSSYKPARLPERLVQGNIPVGLQALPVSSQLSLLLILREGKISYSFSCLEIWMSLNKYKALLLFKLTPPSLKIKRGRLGFKCIQQLAPPLSFHGLSGEAPATSTALFERSSNAIHQLSPSRCDRCGCYLRLINKFQGFFC